MKKLIALYGIYLLLMVITYSCSIEEDYQITGITLSGATIGQRGVDLPSNYYVATDTFTRDIVFVVSYTKQNLYSMNAVVGEKCYALSGNKNYIYDSLDVMKFDRPFTYRGVTFPANTNILANWKIRLQVAVFESNMVFDGRGGEKVFEFTPDFVSNAVFEDAPYNVTFTCFSSDNQKFEKTISVRFPNG